MIKSWPDSVWLSIAKAGTLSCSYKKKIGTYQFCTLNYPLRINVTLVRFVIAVDSHYISGSWLSPSSYVHKRIMLKSLKSKTDLFARFDCWASNRTCTCVGRRHVFPHGVSDHICTVHILKCFEFTVRHCHGMFRAGSRLPDRISDGGPAWKTRNSYICRAFRRTRKYLLCIEVTELCSTKQL